MKKLISKLREFYIQLHEELCGVKKDNTNSFLNTKPKYRTCEPEVRMSLNAWANKFEVSSRVPKRR